MRYQGNTIGGMPEFLGVSKRTLYRHFQHPK